MGSCWTFPISNQTIPIPSQDSISITYDLQMDKTGTRLSVSCLDIELVHLFNPQRLLNWLPKWKHLTIEDFASIETVLSCYFPLSIETFSIPSLSIDTCSKLQMYTELYRRLSEERKGCSSLKPCYLSVEPFTCSICLEDIEFAKNMSWLQHTSSVDQQPVVVHRLCTSCHYRLRSSYCPLCRSIITGVFQLSNPSDA